MITYLVGDATRPQMPGNKIIMHCVNNQCKWGSGFVNALTARWWAPKIHYRELYMIGKNPSLGSVQLVKVEEDILVANIWGQDGVKGPNNPHPVRYSALEAGFKTLAGIQNYNIICAPRLGAGLAGGQWEYIEDLIESTLSHKQVYVYDLPARL